MRAIVLLLLFISPSALAADAQSETEKQIRHDCRADALRYCFTDSMRCLKNENDECRHAVVACMAANKAKLSKKCAQWVW